MQVKNLIEQLQQNYTPETELYVEYWDKEIVEQFMFDGENSQTITDDEWAAVVEAMENSERLDQNMVADSLVDEAKSQIEDREE